MSPLHVSVKHHYSHNNFFWKTTYNKYLLHLSSKYGIKYLEEIYKHECCLGIFGTYSFNDSTDSQYLRSCGSIPPKIILIFPENILNFRPNTSEKQGIKNLFSYSSKMVGWLVGLFYGVSTLFWSFNAELSHFDKSLCVWFGLMAHQSLLVILGQIHFIHVNSSISNNSV